MIAYDTATEDHVFQMINELYRGDGSSRDEVNQWLQGGWKFVISFSHLDKQSLFWWHFTDH